MAFSFLNVFLDHDNSATYMAFTFLIHDFSLSQDNVASVHLFCSLMTVLSRNAMFFDKMKYRNVILQSFSSVKAAVVLGVVQYRLTCLSYGSYIFK